MIRESEDMHRKLAEPLLRYAKTNIFSKIGLQESQTGFSAVFLFCKKVNTSGQLHDQAS